MEHYNLMIINLVLVIYGIFMMAYSTYLSIKIYKIFSSGNHWFSFQGKFKRTWIILPIFVVFFFIAYSFYLFLYLNDFSSDYHLLTSTILFFGALFVLIVVHVNNEVFSMLVKNKIRSRKKSS